MPEVSRFFGIVIYMYSETGGRHHLPHFHALHQENEAVYAIEDLSCLEGGLPPRQNRLVVAWAALHRQELERNWTLLLSGAAPIKIPPLR